MYSWHILLLPIAVVALVAWHVLLVRKHGVVPPFELEQRIAAMAGDDSASDAAERPGAGTSGTPS
jgi:ubiquinol-cytochrome c reductase cytochrome b subunit